MYGISNNTRGGGTSTTAGALGYDPVDDAESFAADIEAVPATDDDEVDGRYLGGSFARP